MRKEEQINEFMEQIDLAARAYGILLPTDVKRCIELRLELMYLEGIQDEMTEMDSVIRNEVTIQN